MGILGSSESIAFTIHNNRKLISTKVFTWEHLNYTVPVPGGTRKLLKGVFGYVKPGTLTALMGASGAGRLMNRAMLFNLT